jgi:hypothetical protein
MSEIINSNLSNVAEDIEEYGEVSLTLESPVVNHLFPNPLVASKLKKEIDTKDINFLKSVSGIDNLSILDDTKLNNLKNIVTEFLDWYKEKIICPKNDIELFITNSWVLNMKAGSYAPAIKHNNSYVSGILVIDVDSSDSKVGFVNLNTNAIAIESNVRNVFNTSQTMVNLENGDIMLFPSQTTHFLPPSKSDSIILLFNCFVKGEIQNFSSPSKLII